MTNYALMYRLGMTPGRSTGRPPRPASRPCWTGKRTIGTARSDEPWISAADAVD